MKPIFRGSSAKALRPSSGSADAAAADFTKLRRVRTFISGLLAGCELASSIGHVGLAEAGGGLGAAARARRHHRENDYRHQIGHGSPELRGKEGESGGLRIKLQGHEQTEEIGAG